MKEHDGGEWPGALGLEEAVVETRKHSQARRLRGEPEIVLSRGGAFHSLRAWTDIRIPGVLCRRRLDAEHESSEQERDHAPHVGPLVRRDLVPAGDPAQHRYHGRGGLDSGPDVI